MADELAQSRVLENYEPSELTDRELLVEMVTTMRYVREVVEQVQTQVGPLLATAKSSPLLKMFGL